MSEYLTHGANSPVSSTDFHQLNTNILCVPEDPVDAAPPQRFVLKPSCAKTSRRVRHFFDDLFYMYY